MDTSTVCGIGPHSSPSCDSPIIVKEKGHALAGAICRNARAGAIRVIVQENGICRVRTTKTGGIRSREKDAYSMHLQAGSARTGIVCVGTNMMIHQESRIHCHIVQIEGKITKGRALGVYIALVSSRDSRNNLCFNYQKTLYATGKALITITFDTIAKPQINI